jgi:hypothetical protein
VFILYAVLIGLVVGFALGGRPSGLAELRFRFAWLAVAGFAAQVVIFSAPLSDRIGDFGAPLYVASTGLVFAVLLVNARIPGLAIVAVGAASNLAAIVANGGYMPASAGALVEAGKVPATGYSNSTVLADPLLAPLTDIFALPRWLPFHNVFSIGDLLIGLGIGLAIVLAMRRRAPTGQEPTAKAPTEHEPTGQTRPTAG